MDKMENESSKVKARWKRPSGRVLACIEKNKVMDENFEEIKGMLKDALDDAILMGCSEASFKKAYLEMISELHSEYPEQTERKSSGS